MEEHEIAPESEVNRLLTDINDYYRTIPRDYRLQKDEKTQRSLLRNLLIAERILTEGPVTIDDLLSARGNMLYVEIELARSRARRVSYLSVGIVSYVFVGFICTSLLGV